MERSGWERWSKEELRARVVVELGWTGRGPGSCGEESGLPRLGSSGASCPQSLRLACFLRAGRAARWQGAYEGSEAVLCLLFFTYYCYYCNPRYIHDYTAACIWLLFAWRSFVVCTRVSSPLTSSPAQLMLARPHPHAAAGKTDLRKPNSDSCRYERHGSSSTVASCLHSSSASSLLCGM